MSTLSAIKISSSSESFGLALRWIQLWSTRVDKACSLHLCSSKRFMGTFGVRWGITNGYCQTGVKVSEWNARHKVNCSQRGFVIEGDATCEDR